MLRTLKKSFDFMLKISTKIILISLVYVLVGVVTQF